MSHPCTIKRHTATLTSLPVLCLLPAPQASCLFLCVPCRAAPYRAVLCLALCLDGTRCVAKCGVGAVIGDSFPATALSMFPHKGASEEGSQADREARGREDMETGGQPVKRQTCKPALYPPHFVTPPTALTLLHQLVIPQFPIPIWLKMCVCLCMRACMN